MWHLYIFCFLSGLFAANGIPHFIKGGLGQKHQTPFGKSSSAVINVCWGWANFAVAAICLHFAHMRAHEYRALVVFAVAALIMTLFNSMNWSKHPEYNKQ
jgi:hypothetical protein